MRSDSFINDRNASIQWHYSWKTIKYFQMYTGMELGAQTFLKFSFYSRKPAIYSICCAFFTDICDHIKTNFNVNIPVFFFISPYILITY